MTGSDNSSERILFLDIETVPLTYRYEELHPATKELWDRKWQYNKDLPPDRHYEKAGVYAEFAKVVCIGAGYFKEGKFRIRSFASEDEKELLEQFSSVLGKHFGNAHRLCAHNGKEFDFPFLCRRFLINGLGLPAVLQIQGKKPWEIPHLDTMELWKFGDYKNYTSLNLLAHIFQIPSPKEDMDGSQVSKVYYEERDLQKIEAYCKKDVVTLARVYRRFAGEPHLHDDDIIFV
jgi:3'-5' exonuclease